MYLQHIPTVIGLLLWPYSQRRLRFSSAASAAIAAFLLLHIIGARYIYSYVPYDGVAQSLTGTTITEAFSFSRNHYDRLVHFSFGLLLTRPVFEVLVTRFRLTPAAARYFSVEFIVAFSAIYELFEWLLTVILAGADAEAYNGQQGDIWDAHKDMALALLGSVFALPCLRFKQVAA
jgi:putative membrane protein